MTNAPPVIASAAALVVGSRHGRFTGLIAGSVSQQALRHAHCPVLVAH
jgi:nucleotide-binding universal stress UspA family protein